MNNRTALIHRIRQRVADGEAKADIYAEYRGTDDAKLAARSLALCVSPALRKKYRTLILLLVAALSILTVLRAYSLFTAWDSLEGLAIDYRLTFGVFLNLVCICGVLMCQPNIYILTFGVSIPVTYEFLEKIVYNNAVIYVAAIPDVVSLGSAVSCMLLSLVLFRRIFPALTWLCSPKHDAAGEPIFD